jgi:hypothetical protein
LRNAVRLLAALSALLLLIVHAPVAHAAVPAATIVLEIFPLAALGDVDPAAGADLSLRLSDEIAGLGGVRIITGGASTAPADYGTVARAAGAGYYLTGSIAAVGSGVAAIVQVVGTRSGTVLWSSTSQLTKIADITGVGAQVRAMLFERDQRPYLDLGSPASAPPPAPSKIAAAPTPNVRPLPIPSDALVDASPPAAAAAAESAVAQGPATVIMLGFSVPPSPLRDLAERALVAAFAQRGVHAGSDAARRGEPIAIYGDRICSETSARVVLSGTVGLDGARQVDAAQPELTTARVQLLAFDCGTRTFEKTIVRSSASLVWTTAVQRAVGAAVGEFAAGTQISGGM